MTASLRQRRRAERFAQLLDEASGGRRQRRRNPLDEELTDLVALRHRLVESAAPPEIDPEFRAGLRAMLVATAEREGIGATTQTPSPAPARTAAPERRRRTWRAEPAPRRTRTPVVRAPRARTAVIAGVAVGAVAFTGMSAASENAMPGDALYGVKRSAERAQLALASSDVGRGALYLGFAQTRLAEARLLGGDLDQVLDDMDRDAIQGVRLLTTAAASRQDYAALDLIDEFAAEQRTALELLGAQVSGADADRVASSLGLLGRIEGRTGQLRDGLDECAGQPVTQLDSLGPIPRDCVALPPPPSLSPAPEQVEHTTEVTAGQAESGTGSESRGTRGSGAGAGPVAEPADEPATPAPEEPVAEAPPSPPAQDEPTAAGEGTQTDDGGLLTGINRLLGNLLGG